MVRVFVILVVLFCIVSCEFPWETQTEYDCPDDDCILVPSVFTPNGTGANDIFEVVHSKGDTVALEIYTRTGLLVFKIEAIRCRWDGYSISGEPMTTGVYYYHAETVTQPQQKKTGFFHLYR